MLLWVYTVIRWFFHALRLLFTIWRRPATVDYVRLPLKGAIPWRTAREDGETLSYTTLKGRLEYLAGRQDIRGVLVVIKPLTASFDRLDAIHGLFAEFRKSGKLLVALLIGRGNAEYFVASAAERVFLTPGPALWLTGWLAQLVHFHPLLARLGLEVEVIRAGSYKSALEPFTRPEPSPETRAAVQHLVDGMADLVLQRVSAARGTTKEDLAALWRAGPHPAQEAAANGLIGGVAHEHELPELLAAGGAEDEAEIVDYWRARRHDPEKPTRPLWPPFRPRLAVLNLRGLIALDGQIPEVADRHLLRVDQAAEVLEELAEDRSIKAVLLNIHSRGGEVLASELLFQAISRLREEKPVVAYLDGIAASGGYYAACGAAEIVAGPAVLTGSIGVVMGHLSVAGILDQAGINAAEISAGGRVDLLSAARPLSAETKELLVREIGQNYELFLSRVAAARRQSVAAVRAVAEGRVWNGVDALHHGLIDRLGTWWDALERTAELAGVGPLARCDVVLAHLPRPWWQFVMRLLNRPDHLELGGLALNRRLGEQAAALALMHKPGAFALCPWFFPPWEGAGDD